MQRWAGGMAVVLVLGTACTRHSTSAPDGVPAATLTTVQAGPLAVMPAEEPVPVDHLVDRLLHLASRPEPVLLEQPPHPALQGTLAPLVVPSPDGRTLAYTTFTDLVDADPALPPSARGVGLGDALGTPSVRLHDLESGREEIVAEGAYSPAWHPDGALAYALGSDPQYRSGLPYTGHVVVRQPGQEEQRWTLAAGRYVVAGWAGGRLIVYHDSGNESFDIEVLDGPGAVRTLAPASSLLALSPDGGRAAVATSANGRSSEVQVLDVATGEPLATLTTDPLTSLVYGGSWVGSRLVARGGDAVGPLVDVFEVGERSLRLVQVLRVDPRLPNGLAEPRLDPAGTGRLTAWSYVPDTRTYVLVRCDLGAASCTSGPPMRARVVRMYSP
jgi:hypothetical protein